jgi:uncharacterized protein YlzI (FlbEa/FlbD family)
VPTYIRFSEDHSVAVSESLEEVEERIRAAEATSVRLFEATRTDGPRMLINANEVRTISEGRKRDSAGKR